MYTSVKKELEIGNVNGLGELASSHSQKYKLVCDIMNIVLIVINSNNNCIFFLVKNNLLLSKFEEKPEILQCGLVITHDNIYRIY